MATTLNQLPTLGSELLAGDKVYVIRNNDDGAVELGANFAGGGGGLDTTAGDARYRRQINAIALTDLTQDLQNTITRALTVSAADGNNGWSPVFSVQEDGERRIYRLESWVGGTGDTPGQLGAYLGTRGFTLSPEEAVNIRGSAGAQGDDGWSPVFALEARGNDVIQKVVDWVGGDGSKPGINVFVAAAGFTSDATLALNVRGLRGFQGNVFFRIFRAVAKNAARPATPSTTAGSYNNATSTITPPASWFDDVPPGFNETTQDLYEVTGSFNPSTNSITSYTTPIISGGTGPAGDRGWTPRYAIVTDSQRRVLRLVSYVGGTGTSPAIPTNNYVGATGLTTLANAVNVRGAAGTDGNNGDPGTNGWSPVWNLVRRTSDNAQVILIRDWVAGSGTKPPVNVYVPATGTAFTANIANAAAVSPDIPDTAEVWARLGNTDQIPPRKFYQGVYDQTFALSDFGNTTTTGWRTVTSNASTRDAWAFNFDATSAPTQAYFVSELSVSGGLTVVPNLRARVSGGALQVALVSGSSNDVATWGVTLTPKVGPSDADLNARIRAHTGQANDNAEINANRIPNLPASKVTSGTFNANRIPNIPAAKLPDATTSTKGAVIRADAAAITAGTANRIPDAAQLKAATAGITGLNDLALTITGNNAFTLPANWRDYAGLVVVLATGSPRSRFFDRETLAALVTANNTAFPVSSATSIRSPTNSRAIVRASGSVVITRATMVGGAAGQSGFVFQRASIYIRTANNAAQPATPTAATVTRNAGNTDFVYANLPTNWTSDLSSILTGYNPSSHRIWESSQLYDGRDGTFNGEWETPFPAAGSDFALPTLSLSGVSRTIPATLEALIQPLVTSGEVSF